MIFTRYHHDRHTKRVEQHGKTHYRNRRSGCVPSSDEVGSHPIGKEDEDDCV